MSGCTLTNQVSEKPLILYREEAHNIHVEIVERLKRLVNNNPTTCLADDFKRQYRDILELFTLYQQARLKHHPYKVACSRGCWMCCCHWVIDVYSFEAEIIGDYVRKNFPDKITHILEVLKEDCKWMERIHKIVEQQIVEIECTENKLCSDYVDMLLASYYRLLRPCPFLNESKECIIYSVRPLTCRVYINFSSPLSCYPQRINNNETTTQLLDMEEDASRLLDQLHFRFDRFDGDTGLRSLMLKVLENF